MYNELAVLLSGFMNSGKAFCQTATDALRKHYCCHKCCECIPHIVLAWEQGYVTVELGSYACLLFLDELGVLASLVWEISTLDITFR